jgi:hypothetical protein
MKFLRNLTTACFVLSVLVLFAPERLWADILLRRVDLEKTVRVRFPLERSVFLVDQGQGSVTFHRGFHVELPVTQSHFDNSKLWLVTTRLDVPYQLDKINFGVLLVGTGGELGFVSPEKEPLPTESLSEATVAQIRSQLSSEQQRSLGLSQAFKEKQSEHRLLENRLEVLAGGEEYKALLEQEELIQGRLKSLAADIDSLKKSLESVAKGKDSVVLAQRERGLSQQIVELAEAVRLAESEEHSRPGSQSDVEMSRILIERAAGYSVEGLQEELNSLRQRRVDLRRRVEE